jgi:ankyrin repeat protein
MLDAAARGDVETLKRLIAEGVSLETTNAAGETPLLLAVRNDQSIFGSPTHSCRRQHQCPGGQ